MRMYYDQDANQGRLTGKTVAVIGYGSQGHAHAQNLRDSGIQVVVGLRQGKSWNQAEADGFSVMTVGEAAQAADILMILLPDERQSQVYHEEILPNLRAEQLILFAHGFNIHFGQIQPPKSVDVAMVAPKGPGHMVRRVYTEGGGVPSLIAVHQDSTGHAFDTALAYAWAIGGTRAGVIETSFKEETETDLFGEQTVLCGGISELVKAGFDTLVEAGYAPEMAYFECLHELKLIVDLMYEGGLARMRYSISDTAEFGDYVSGPRIIGPEVRERMKQVLAEIQTGQFARSWILENQSGRAFFNAKRRLEAQHPVEEVGSRLREMMTWIQSR